MQSLLVDFIVCYVTMFTLLLNKKASIVLDYEVWCRYHWESLTWSPLKLDMLMARMSRLHFSRAFCCYSVQQLSSTKFTESKFNRILFLYIKFVGVCVEYFCVDPLLVIKFKWLPELLVIMSVWC
ncbi:uncharacterized protein LOC120350190 [Nilaparvata lugens]|uniref:uncharacterized protein LOC120350190 n=1 Tax=Nilaparvata lugens TaxID=108931 RepID=UPI00193D0155|nr:uncharacterized protein LOC120350190 [Nilaparvata lugens]